MATFAQVNVGAKNIFKISLYVRKIPVNLCVCHCHIIWLIWVVRYLKSKSLYPSVGLRYRPQVLYIFGKLINRRTDLGGETLREKKTIFDPKKGWEQNPPPPPRFFLCYKLSKNV